jgi:hypothetical protein
MNKLILCLVVLFSFSLFAQEEDTVPELNAEGVEITPETTTSEAVAPVTEEAAPVVTEEAAPVVTEEAAPVVTEEAAPAVTEEATPVVNEEPPVIADEPRPVSSPTPLSSQTPALITETDFYEQRHFNPRESHWVTSFTFEGGKYEIIPKEYEFEGRKDFKNGYKQLYGGRLGFGGEIYLGAGFVTRSMVEAYYLGTLFSRVLNGGAEAEDVDFAFTKQTGQLMGGDASQSLGWMFDFKTKNPLMDEWAYLAVEIYVDAGIGKAWAHNRTNYSYDTGTAPRAAQESYKLTVKDDLLNARVGAGMNFTSSSGFFLALKATVNRLEVTDRRIKGFIQENGQVPDPIDDSPKDVNIDPVVIYTVGGGYKF